MQRVQLSPGPGVYGVELQKLEDRRAREMIVFGGTSSRIQGPDRGPFPFPRDTYALRPMTRPRKIRHLPALLALALLALPAGKAAADDIYEAGWNGGHLTATANADFTEATIESVTASLDNCGTDPKETSCTWEAIATLHSGDDRCNPATPEDQVVW